MTVYESRDLYATRSRAISDNPTLTPEARRDQFNALAREATKDLQAKLGQQGAELYVQRSNWVNMLKGGTAFSTDAKDPPPGMFLQGTSIFPIQNRPPPNAPGSTPTAPATKPGSN